MQFEGAMAGDLKTSIEKLEARTKAGRLRSLMPMIEAKVKQGIRHVEIIQALNDENCTCGCGLSVAKCRIDDPSCTVSLPIAKTIVARHLAGR